MNSWHFITQQLLLNNIFKEYRTKEGVPLKKYSREQNSGKAETRAQESPRPVTLLDTKKRITNQNCSYNYWFKF